MIREEALTLSKAIAEKKIAPSELMQATLDRIEAVNGKVNALVSLREPDALMTEARAFDDTPRRGWLHGIPIAIKDLADAKGLPTSKGSPLFEGVIADQDDVMVARLRAAGAIVIGKTNTPEFGLGSHTYNPVHGATLNPYDPAKTCGGSSGGAAVALATGMLAVADGSDMMGSLRNPAAWNNVYGMRPTWGVVPSESEGDVFMDQLSTLGPMARSPGDLAALLDVMKGRQSLYPHAYDVADTLPAIKRGQTSPRIAWLGDWGGGLPYEAGITELSEAALSQMADLGWTVETPPPPFSLDALWQSWVSLRAFAHGQRLRPMYDDPDLRQRLKTSAQWEVEQYIQMSAEQVFQASLIRSDWFRRAADFFSQYDAMVLPSAQVWPFPVEQEHPTEIAGVRMDTYHRWMHVTVPASLIGLPAISIPIGFGDADLPAGLQLIGAQGSDAALLGLAHIWHSATEWPQKRPGVP